MALDYVVRIYRVILTHGITWATGNNQFVIPYKGGDTQALLNYPGGGGHMLLVNGGKTVLVDDTDTFQVTFQAGGIMITWNHKLLSVGDTDELVFIFNFVADRVLYDTATAQALLQSVSDLNNTVALAQAAVTAAQAASTAAQSARDTTLAAYDSFDDRYLGTKSAEPTTDNDGNPLVGGALFFDTTAGYMKLWTGTFWTQAYTNGSGYLGTAQNLSDVTNPAAAFTNIKQAASEVDTGVAAIATDAEVAAGTDDSRFVTAFKLANRLLSWISGLTAVSPTTNDYVAIADASDSGRFKKALISDLLALTNSATDDYGRYQALLNALVERRKSGTQGGTGLVNGHVDAYLSDTIGAASTDETYNSTNKYYENPPWIVTNSANGLWSGQTGHYTFTDANISKSATSQNGVYVTSSVSGDFEYEATLSYTTVGTASIYLGVFAASEVGTWISGTDAGNTRAMTNSFAIQISNGAIYYGSSSVGSISYASGDVWKITRVGSTLNLYRNGAIVHTLAFFSSDVKLFLQTYKNGEAWNNVSWRVPGPAKNMTLMRCSAITATAVPSTAWIVTMVDPVSSVTYNTDYTLEVTSNNGTNWHAVPLTNVGSYDGAFDILVGKVAMSGGATSINYRKRSLNNKELRDAGIAMMWE